MVTTALSDPVAIQPTTERTCFVLDGMNFFHKSKMKDMIKLKDLQLHCYLFRQLRNKNTVQISTVQISPSTIVKQKYNESYYPTQRINRQKAVNQTVNIIYSMCKSFIAAYGTT